MGYIVTFYLFVCLCSACVVFDVQYCSIWDYILRLIFRRFKLYPFNHIYIENLSFNCVKSCPVISRVKFVPVWLKRVSDFIYLVRIDISHLHLEYPMHRALFNYAGLLQKVFLNFFQGEGLQYILLKF